MCGRYYIKITEEELREIIDGIVQENEDTPEQMSFFGDEDKAVLDVCPGMTVPVVTQNGLQKMKWGFPNKEGKLLINVRSETAEVLFRKPMQERRCLIPASGYYEWQETGGPRKSKYRFYMPEGVIYLAGCWQVEENSDVAKFVVLTRAATEAFNQIHDRMPVIIPAYKIDEWLNENADAMANPVLELAHQRA